MTANNNEHAAREANILWFLPTSGDGRYLGASEGAREVNFRYLRQVALAAEDLGYYGVLIPTGRSCDDPFVVASATAALTQRLRLLVALRPGGLSPTVAARMATALDRVSEGRLLINVVAGGDPVESRGDGVFLDHDQRYEATREFLHVWTRLLAGESVTFSGAHYTVEDARQAIPPIQRPRPPLFFGGSSPIAHDLAAEAVDTYLTWGEPPAAVEAKFADVRSRAAAKGRKLRFGVRLQVIVRETEAEARAAADRLISRLDDATIAATQKTLARLDSEGQARITALHGGRRDRLEISPNLWGGIGLVRGGAGTALVGDPHQVADRIREYMALGADNFVLSGYPHLEEAYRFAELVFPLLPLAAETGRPKGFVSIHGPFGERSDLEEAQSQRRAAQS